MRKPSLLTCLLAFCMFYAQAQDFPVLLEAESGILGSDWETGTSLGTTYIRPKTNLLNGNYPGDASKVVTYTVTFPKAGVYDLYAKVKVGSGAANDDSFFYGKSFGTKNPSTDNNEWVTCNNLSGRGYIYLESPIIVEGAGGGGTEIWKWINLSKFNGGETPVTFTVPAGNLTQTFQIGGREDGMDIDKFVFGHSGQYYSVQNLSNGEAGMHTKPLPVIPTSQPIATGKPKYIGQVYSITESQTPYFENYWNQVAPGNGGKWGTIERTRDVMDWTECDKALKLATDNGFPFRFHVLVWGRQQPAWMANLSPAEQLEEIKEWFQAVAERYPDIEMVEVVNEPTHAPPVTGGVDYGNYKEALGGDGVTGWDWILNAFRLARQYFPASTKLMLNDYHLENHASTREQFIQIVNLLKAENLIDAIGTQGHAFSTKGTASSIKAALDQMAATGVPIYVTEMDIDGINTTTGELDDQLQLESYQKVFPVYWEHPMVAGITFHGWRVGQWRTNEGAFLIYSDNTERPALQWLRSYVENYSFDNPPAPPVKESPVVLQAESGELGSDFAVVESGGVNYITAKTDLANSTSPGNASKVAGYSVKFPSTGTYDLYVRVRVGSGGFNDDSYYYARGFGVKGASTSSDWVRVNNLANVGYTAPEDVVDKAGNAGSLVWKWINLSRFTGDGPPVSFNVGSSNLTYVFQMGSRENGLDVDMFAFGKSDESYTVKELEEAALMQTTVVVEGGSFMYDGLPHAATGFAYGAGGEVEKLSPRLSFTYTSADNAVLESAPVKVGTYTVTATFQGNSSYKPGFATASITISPRPLIITAADQEIECGSAVELGSTSFVADGLVSDDMVYGVSLTSSGGGVGTYPIAPGNATGVGLSNYTITYEYGTLLVKDETKPAITYSPVVPVQCYNSAGIYTIPALVATDGCGIVNTRYTITGATSRSGNGADASGSFNSGANTINWIVDDGHGNQSTAQTTVTVNEPLTASIPDVYAVNPAVDAKNTIYMGYGPTSLTISVTPEGGTSPYTYKWNTGHETPALSVSAAGTYTVTVSDKYNCTTTASVIIKTQDVRCGNNDDKVTLCHNGKEICIASAAVQEHLDHGDTLGGCESTVSSLSVSKVTGEATTKGVTIYPNPVQDEIYINFSEGTSQVTQIEILDLSGRILLKKLSNGNPAMVVPVAKLQSGTYIIRIYTDKVITYKFVKL